MSDDKRRLYVRKRKGKLSDHVELSEDPWYVASKRKLKASIEHKMKRIFVGTLEALDNEKSSGKISDETFKRLRQKILNIGNDQIRTMRMELDSRYNVESLNYHVEFKVQQEERSDNEG